MAAEPQREPGDPGASVEPVKQDSDSVPAEWLTESGHAGLADSVDRLAADEELVMMLALGGYQGRDWDYFSTELARYGLAVFGGWMYTGVIFQRCQARGYGGLPRLDRQFTSDEIEELKNETVAKALHHFRTDVLIPRKWSSSKGASLRTYFIGQGIIRFANIYRRWHANESRFRQADSLDDHDLLIDAAGRDRTDTANRAVDRIIADRALALIKDPRTRRAIALTAQGRSQAEIAEELSVTVKTVERMLANERKRQRERRAG